MGYASGQIKLICELYQRGYLKNIKSVMEMGSQELNIKLRALEELVNAAGLPNFKREVFKNMADYPNSGRCSIKPFYEMLGVENYSSIDMGGEFGAIPHDLNLPFEDKKQYGTYDLVTDNGTCEHAFNVVEAYQTMHRLLKPQGLMITTQGVYRGNGYLYFDWSFFEGLAAANNYKVLYSSYIIISANHTDQYHVPVSPELLRIIDWAKVDFIGISYVMQKQNESDVLQFPYQYHTNKNDIQGYRLQFLPNPPGYTYMPMVRGVETTPTKDLLRHIAGRVPILRNLGIKFKL